MLGDSQAIRPGFAVEIGSPDSLRVRVRKIYPIGLATRGERVRHAGRVHDLPCCFDAIDREFGLIKGPARVAG